MRDARAVQLRRRLVEGREAAGGCEHVASEPGDHVAQAGGQNARRGRGALDDELLVLHGESDAGVRAG